MNSLMQSNPGNQGGRMYQQAGSQSPIDRPHWKTVSLKQCLLTVISGSQGFSVLTVLQIHASFNTMALFGKILALMLTALEDVGRQPS